jgi:hypothetical protein
MFREPWKFRGEVIPVKGRLKMLRRRDLPLQAADAARFLYEGWVFTETRNSNPVVVVFPDLPVDVKTGEQVDYKVEFNGYFLMRFRYLTGEGKNTWRDTLLFVAPTISVLGAAPGAAKDSSGTATFGQLSGAILTGMIILVAGTMLLVLGLGWWFRRGDKRFHHHLTRVRAGMFAESELAGEQPTSEKTTGIRHEMPPPEGPHDLSGPEV